MTVIDDFLERQNLSRRGRNYEKWLKLRENGSTDKTIDPKDILAWMETVRQLKLSDSQARTTRADLIEGWDRWLSDPTRFLGKPSACVRAACAALDSDALLYSTSMSDIESRHAVIRLLNAARLENESNVVGENYLSEIFGADSAKVRRWTDWAIGEEWVEITVKTLLDRQIRITTKGMDWLENATAPLVPAAVAQTVALRITSARPSLDVSFVKDTAVRGVLERNIRELIEAERLELVTAAIVLAGSIGEGVLYDVLVRNKTAAMAASSAPKDKQRQVKDIETEDWKFDNYITVAGELNFLEKATTKMVHSVLQDFRNMIHPKVQVTKKLVPDVPEMRASIAWLEATLRDLRSVP